MAVLDFVCGLPGSGKSNLAERLAREEQALWLSPDVGMSRLVGDGYDEAKRDEVERLQWEIAERVLNLGAEDLERWSVLFEPPAADELA